MVKKIDLTKLSMEHALVLFGGMLGSQQPLVQIIDIGDARDVTFTFAANQRINLALHNNAINRANATLRGGNQATKDGLAALQRYDQSIMEAVVPERCHPVVVHVRHHREVIVGAPSTNLLFAGTDDNAQLFLAVLELLNGEAGLVFDGRSDNFGSVRSIIDQHRGDAIESGHLTASTTSTWPDSRPLV